MRLCGGIGRRFSLYCPSLTNGMPLAPRRGGAEHQGAQARGKAHPSGQHVQEHDEPPQNRLRDAGQPARERAEATGQMGGGAYLRAGAREEQGRQAAHPARRPAVRERPHPHRARLQQDPQGLRQQVPCAARLLHALRARLGLPRPTHRAHGGEDARPREDGEDRPAHAAPPLSRVGREVRRRATRGLQAPRRERRLGAPLPHVHPELRGGQRRGVQEDVPGRLGVPRPQAHPLVQALPHRARRGRDRVFGRGIAVHLRALQA